MKSILGKDALSIVLGGLGVAAFATPALAQSNKKQEKSNIILIMTDQQTANAMSCAGNKYVKTPGMDALAADGVRFSRSYVSYPLSGPSRASLVTGKMPVELGVKDNNIGDISAEELANSIGNTISSAGYDCLYAGKWHAPIEINLPKEGTGFTWVSDMNDPELVDKVIPFLEQKRDNPLFLVASFLNPHEICEFARDEALHYGALDEAKVSDCPILPYNAVVPAYYPEAISLHRKEMSKLYPTETYTDNDWRQYLYAYYRLVERVDHEIVRLIDQLKKNDLYDNSLILFVSDHGDGAAAHRANQKRVLQDEILRVPFIVKAPKSKSALKNVVNDKALVATNLDIYQTFCDYAGIGERKDLRGKSIRPIMEGKTETHHDYVFAETILDGLDIRGWSVIGEDYKYTMYRFFQNKGQLFDVKNDPYEMQNLAVDKSLKPVVDAMKKRLYDHAVLTNDQLLIRLLKNEVNP